MKIEGKNYSFEDPQNNIGIDEVTRNNKNLKSIFAYFDKNGDNKLSTKEIQEAFTIFKKLDNSAGDADGIISDAEIEQRLRILPDDSKITVDDYKNFIRSLASTNRGKKLAKDLFNQIKGPSWFNNTLKILGKIDETNIVELLREYKILSPKETIAEAIDNELGLGIEDVKSYICKPLIMRAKSLNINNVRHSDYNNITDIKILNKYITNLQTKIIKKEIDIAKKDSIDPIKRDPQYKKIYRIVDNQLVKRIYKGSHAGYYKTISELPQNIQAKYIQKAEDVTKMVIEKCRKYDIEAIAPVIAQVLAMESGGFNFTDSVMKDNKLYKGVMQVNLKTCQCIFSEGGKDYKDWHKLHFSRDDARINELKRKYKTAQKLYTAIQSDVKLGLEVGIIALKAKIHIANNSVAGGIALYCGSNYKCDLTGVPAYLK